MIFSKEYNRFLLFLSILFVAVKGLIFSVYISRIISIELIALLLMNVFFLVLTATVHAWLIYVGKGRVQRFINSFMITTVLKLLIYFLVLITYVFTHRETAKEFILFFLVLYFLYTSFEVVNIVKHVRRESKQE